jgi:hypothetical protein
MMVSAQSRQSKLRSLFSVIKPSVKVLPALLLCRKHTFPNPLNGTWTRVREKILFGKPYDADLCKQEGATESCYERHMLRMLFCRPVATHSKKDSLLLIWSQSLPFLC